jgi:hypothetical protein
MDLTQQLRNSYSGTFVALKSPHSVSKNVYIEKKCHLNMKHHTAAAKPELEIYG